MKPRPAFLSRLPRLVLASQSARRRQLMTEHGLDHHAIHPGIDDATLEPGDASPRQWVRALAYMKASAGCDTLRRQTHDATAPALVIAADTICVKDDCILSQPLTENQARATLLHLRRGSHRVLTGLAILRFPMESHDALDRILLVDEAAVTWGDVADIDIDRYVASGLWKGKAGAYNLHERLDAGWPITFAGDPTTITGLPMPLLLHTLERLANRYPS